MAEKNIDAHAIKGTGKDGRITKEDVLAYEVRIDPHRQPRLPPQARGVRQEERFPCLVCERVCERLVEVQQTAAILATFND